MQLDVRSLGRLSLAQEYALDIVNPPLVAVKAGPHNKDVDVANIGDYREDEKDDLATSVEVF